MKTVAEISITYIRSHRSIQRAALRPVENARVLIRDIRNTLDVHLDHLGRTCQIWRHTRERCFVQERVVFPVKAAPTSAQRTSRIRHARGEAVWAGPDR